MPNPKLISDLFHKKPQQWGLRGDPYLWDDLKTYFAEVELPVSETELLHQLEDAFLQLTGSTVADSADFYVPKYSHGGMSSGEVCTEFWRVSAIPLLIKRYIKHAVSR